MTHQETGLTAQTTLLVAAASGDGKAAQALTAELAPRAFAQAVRMLGNRSDAEDVVQDAMMRLWRAAPNWDIEGGALPSSWLYRVVANLCIDRMRRGARYGGDLSSIPEPEDPSPGAEVVLQEQSRYDALYSALEDLPERQRQAVVLRHIEGLTNPEIADALSVGIEAVESLTARGKKALSKLLGSKRDELGYFDEQA